MYMYCKTSDDPDSVDLNIKPTFECIGDEIVVLVNSDQKNDDVNIC